MKEQFGADKLYGHLDRVAGIKSGKLVAPVTVELHPTNHCNAKCVWCVEKFRREATSMSRDVLVRVLGEMSRVGVRGVVWEGGGEPTLYKELDDLILISSGLGMRNGLTTNGHGLWKKPFLAQTVAKHMDWVRFSIAAATPEKYGRIHGVPAEELDRVLEAARSLRSMSKKLTIGWSYIVADDDIEDMKLAALKAFQYGIDYIKFKPLQEDPKVCRASSAQLIARLKEVKERADCPGFQVYMSTEALEEAPKRYKRCLAHQLTVQVAATGIVYVCCNLALMDYEGSGWDPEMIRIGNVHEESFADIVMGPKHEEIRQRLLIPGVVERCPSCRMDRYNELLEDICETERSIFI